MAFQSRPAVRWFLSGLVIAAAVLLVLIAMPEHRMTQEARESVLATNLGVLRSALAEYEAKNGHGPQALKELVSENYLPRLPLDPMHDATNEWGVRRSREGTIVDVYSLSDDVARDGSFYKNW